MIKFTHITKAATALLLASALAGCFDIKMEIDVAGPDKAVATIETTVSKEIVDMAQLQSGESDFCNEGGKIVENEDTVTCTETKQGTFAEIEGLGDADEPRPTIAAVNGNQTRVEFPISAWRKDMATGTDDESEQAMAMMKQMFAGHAMTLRVKGKKVVETNMTETEPGTAELVITLTDLFNPNADVPETAYAVVENP